MSTHQKYGGNARKAECRAHGTDQQESLPSHLVDHGHGNHEPGPDNPDLKKPATHNEFLPGRANPNRRDKNNFAPQLGLAWDPSGSGKWVVRAGAGVFFDTNLLKHVIFERNNNLPLGITQEAGQLLRDPITNNVLFDLNGRPSNPPAQITPGVNWVGQPLGGRPG